jgi:hypothetical protein
MNPKAEELRRKLIRNFLDVPRQRIVRKPLYDGMTSSLSDGTVAGKLRSV